MNQAKKPVLSIGIIFKNEVRCLERCLQSLAPLREAIPSELVMADTGSDDGSREIAEKYADILFDFPWINDFAAARNSVMDRCSGQWYFAVDCDEWLDGDLSDLLHELRTNQEDDFGVINVRNYTTQDLEASGKYTDFGAFRFLRLSTKVRYAGAIHERWYMDNTSKSAFRVQGALLHHDGYVPGYWSVGKSERNLTLLREELEKTPENLLLLLQCVESSEEPKEVLEYASRGRELVLKKQDAWENVGPPLLRYAAYAAQNTKHPAAREWIRDAQNMFPNSLYTRIDVSWFAFDFAWQDSDYKECVRLGERYFQGVDDLNAGRYEPGELLFSSLLLGAPAWYNHMATFWADACQREGDPERALEILNRVDGKLLDVGQTENFLKVFFKLYGEHNLETGSLVRRIWEEITTPEPSQAQMEARREKFGQIASELFTFQYMENEKQSPSFCRHACTALLPLEGLCDLGDAAALVVEEDPQVLAEKLRRQENLKEVPPAALEHALLLGVPFPDRALNAEEMSVLVSNLAKHRAGFFQVVEKAAQEDFASEWDKLVWTQKLTLAAMRTCGWKEGDEGVSTARTFAKVQGAFLQRYYTAQALENIHTIPSLHRFGHYCAQAFQALKGGDAAGYVRQLRLGLEVGEEVRPIVEYLVKNTPELQPPKPSEEMLALAEQVRTVLAMYPADHPAVEALKASESYQKVAYLVEGAQAPVFGGLVQ